MHESAIQWQWRNNATLQRGYDEVSHHLTMAHRTRRQIPKTHCVVMALSISSKSKTVTTIRLMEVEGEDDVKRRSATIRSGRRQRNDPRQHGDEPCTSLAQSTGMLL